MVVIFFNSVLEIVVDKDSVAWRYFPLFRRWRRIEREEILGFEARNYYFRGHGFHRDFHGNKRVSVKGTQGIEITLAGGSKLTLGTQQQDEFLAALKKMKTRSVN